MATPPPPPTDSVVIPRTFHQVWVGDQAMPQEFLAWAWSWRQFNPDWTLCLWVEHPELFDRQALGEMGVLSPPWHEIRRLPALWTAHLLKQVAQLVGDEQRLACASDIIRLELVARFGGVYLDTDVECFAPIDPVLEGVRLFNCDEHGPHFGNYCFGAVPLHPAMVSAVRHLDRQFEQARSAVVVKASRRRPWRRRDCDLVSGRLRRQLARLLLGYRERRERHQASAVHLTGPNYLCRELQGHPDYVLLPWPVMCPLSAWHDYRMVTTWPETAVGNHHFYGTWYDRKKGPPPPEFRFGATPPRRFTGPADKGA